jgi:hypothetical protein
MSNDSKDSVATADRVWKQYLRDRDAGHTDYVDDAKKFDDFYVGDQWDSKDKQKLKAQGRPALTINTILSTINTVLGEQSSNRADIAFKPRRDATQQVADIMTQVAMQVTDNNQYEWIESQVFADGLIQDRGYIDLRMDFDDHIEGEVRMSDVDPKDVILDPEAKDYDPKTWNRVTVSRWVSLEDIELTYGKDKAQRIKDLVGSGQDRGHDSIIYNDGTFGTTDSVTPQEVDSDPELDRTIKKIRIIDVQQRKLQMAEHFANPTTGDLRLVPEHWSKEQAHFFAEQYGFLIHKKLIRRVRWTVAADKVLLHDKWSPYKEFTIVPYFPYFRRGRPFGMVRNLISPQEQLNKVSSQLLHVVNSSANGGWKIETGSLANMTPEQLETRGAETGLVVEYNKGSAPPEKILPNQIPTGLTNISQTAQQNIQSISGINDGMRGETSAEVSGVALQQKQLRGSIQIQSPLDNLARTRYLVAQRMVELIQGFYTEPRIMQVTNYNDPAKQSQTISINQQSPTGEVINNITMGEYDIVVTSQPARDNFDESQFAEAISLREAGIMVPDDAVIEYSHLNRKTELAERVRQMMGQGELTEEQQQMQQMQMQIEMQRIQLELGNLEADLQKKQSEIALNQAKALDYETDEGSLELEIMKLQSDIQMKREDFRNKLELAGVHTQANMLNKQIDAKTKIALEAMKPAPTSSSQPSQGAANKNPVKALH